MFDREEVPPNREQELYLSSTEDKIWHSGFIDFEFSLNGTKVRLAYEIFELKIF